MKVLVADDDATSRIILERMLPKWGYHVATTCDGEEAWESIRTASAPLIAVLDWLMPGMTGPEVCRKIAERESGPFVYMVILTGKTKESDKIEGLNSGAHAFVQKPYDPLELASCLAVGRRVIEYETKLREKNDELQDYVEHMEKLADERARQLAHADRMATVGMLGAGVAHEINNPATFISGNAQTLEQAWQVIERKLQEGMKIVDGDTEQIEFVLEEVPKMLEGIREGVRRIRKITDTLKGFAHHGEGQRELVYIHEAVEKALELCRNALKYNVSIHPNADPSLPPIRGDRQQIEQVLVNLFVNAAHAMKGRPDSNLYITAWRDSDRIQLTVEDDGPGFPPDTDKKIFDPFFTTKEAGIGTGLGLSISQSIIEEHSGTIVAENRESKGARFTIRLPIAPEARENAGPQVSADTAAGGY